MATTVSLHEIFETYNAQESYLPYFIPLTFWVSTWIYCEYKMPETKYRNWFEIPNIHHVLCILYGSLALYYDDESIFPERNVTLFSLSYFTVEFLDMAREGDLIYCFHAMCIIFLGLSTYHQSIIQRLKLSSKTTYLELSSPLFQLCKKTRNPLHFALFALVFTLCRIIWLPIMLRQVLDDGFPWTDFRFFVALAFYGLNLFWYYKILKILITGQEPPPLKKKNDGNTESSKKKK